ncbi:MAG TPA: tRNA lysidine(34) synthetase TilS [Wenzhouxiangellaceae bacterium]|nr:tRNA lysidine(34) synthetase TilS [Wenzhouxiangellaceae bacterium]
MTATNGSDAAPEPGIRPIPDIDTHAISPTGTNWVAFSGGPDSVCLLHLLIAAGLGSRVRVVHIDHGLDEHSPDRALRAIEISAGMGVDCRLERLDPLQPRGAGGPEAAARHARYARLQALMQPGDHVLTAHHADDQVETVMLRLLRGAGPGGLRGMQPLRRLAPGWLGRPLLAWTRAEILEYLRRHEIDYLQDPTNRDLSLDRNYLRHRVLPEIARRWPGYRSSILQSSRWQRAAARSMDAQAERTLELISRARDGSGETTLDAADWLALEPEHGFAVIRAWCAREFIAAPNTRPLAEFRAQCASARADRQPVLDWPAAHLHAWRGRLWLDHKPDVPSDWQCNWPDGALCRLPVGGSLAWSGVARGEIGKCWQLAQPRRGARLQLHADGPAKEVSELMREAGIPPWRRHAYPALSIDGRLCAVGVEWLDASFAERLAQTESRLEWQQRPESLLP